MEKQYKIFFALFLLLSFFACQEDVQQDLTIYPPTNIAAIDQPGQVLITWSASEYETNAYFNGYNVFISTEPLNDSDANELYQANVSPIIGHSFVSGDVEVGQSYFIHVRTVGQDGEMSEPSETAYFIKEYAELSPPANLKLSSLGDGHSILITWSLNSIPGCKYQIALNDSVIASGLEGTVFEHTNPQELGDYEITAIYEGFESEPSVATTQPYEGYSQMMYFYGDTLGGNNCLSWNVIGELTVDDISSCTIDIQHVVFDYTGEDRYIRSAHFYGAGGTTYITSLRTVDFVLTQLLPTSLEDYDFEAHNIALNHVMAFALPIDGTYYYAKIQFIEIGAFGQSAKIRYKFQTVPNFKMI